MRGEYYIMTDFEKEIDNGIAQYFSKEGNINAFVNRLCNNPFFMQQLKTCFLNSLDRYPLHTLEDYTLGSTIDDIYDDDTINTALDYLRTNHKVLVLGSSGNGKTAFCKMIASRLTGINCNITGPEVYLKRYCRTVANNIVPFYSENGLVRGILSRFIDYIYETCIEEPCVFYGDEVQRYPLKALFNNAYSESFELPENLYIICSGLDVETMDKKIFKTVEIKGIQKDNTVTHKKLCNLYGNKIDHFEDLLIKFEDINSCSSSPIVRVGGLYTFIATNMLPVLLKDNQIKDEQKLTDTIEDLINNYKLRFINRFNSVFLDGILSRCYGTLE